MADEIVESVEEEKPAEPASLTTLAIGGHEIVIVRTKTAIGWANVDGEIMESLDHADPWGDEAKELIITKALASLAA